MEVGEEGGERWAKAAAMRAVSAVGDTQAPRMMSVLMHGE